MRIKKLIKRFDFEEYNRSLITFGENVRMDPKWGKLQLKWIGLEGYSKDENLYAKTWIVNPNSVKQWLGFEAVCQHSYDDLGQPVTFVNFRLGDGEKEYVWDGAEWAEAEEDEWNTEAEVANNISGFPIQTRKIQVVINLLTTSSADTPYVEAVKILYASDIEFQEDIIYRSLVPMMKGWIRPIAINPITMPDSGDEIDITAFPMDTPYDIDGIDSIYDHTNDPEHFYNLLLSYDPGTKIIELVEAIEEGSQVWIQFTYKPLVAVSTDQEYFEIDRVPSIVLGDIEFDASSEYPANMDSVANKSTGSAVVVEGPIYSDIRISMTLITDKARDQVRLADEARSFFANNTFVTSYGLDEIYDLELGTDYRSQFSPNQKGLHAGVIMFRIKKALYFYKYEKDASIVKSFKISGDVDVTI